MHVTTEFVHEGFGYLNARKLEQFFGLYSPALSNPSLATMGLPTNKTGFQAFVGMFYEAFSQPEFLPQTVLTDGPTAMFRWTFKGKHTGVFNGVKPTGKPVEVTCFTTFRRGADGLVDEQYDLADMGTLMRQIGAAP